jgi:hypothetical protein
VEAVGGSLLPYLIGTAARPFEESLPRPRTGALGQQLLQEQQAAERTRARLPVDRDKVIDLTPEPTPEVPPTTTKQIEGPKGAGSTQPGDSKGRLSDRVKETDQRLQNEGQPSPDASPSPKVDTWPDSDIPLPPGVKLDKNGVPYRVRGGAKVKREHYDPDYKQPKRSREGKNQQGAQT